MLRAKGPAEAATARGGAAGEQHGVEEARVARVEALHGEASPGDGLPHLLGVVRGAEGPHNRSPLLALASRAAAVKGRRDPIVCKQPAMVATVSLHRFGS